MYGLITAAMEMLWSPADFKGAKKHPQCFCWKVHDSYLRGKKQVDKFVVVKCYFKFVTIRFIDGQT